MRGSRNKGYGIINRDRGRAAIAIGASWQVCRAVGQAPPYSDPIIPRNRCAKVISVRERVEMFYTRRRSMAASHSSKGVNNMSSDDNLYRAPRSSLQTTAQDDDLTPAAREYLSKGAFWARLQSVGYFIAFVFALLAVALFLFAGEDMAGRDAATISRMIALIAGLPLLVILWMLGVRMHCYAKASKALRMNSSMDDAELCFINSTSFFKIMAVLNILQFALAVFAILGALGTTAAFR